MLTVADEIVDEVRPPRPGEDLEEWASKMPAPEPEPAAKPFEPEQYEDVRTPFKD